MNNNQEALALPLKYHRERELTGASLTSLFVQVFLVCLGYYLGALLGKTLRFPASHLSLIWPPTAVLLTALLLAPKRLWCVFLAAVTPVHILMQLQDGVPLWAIVSQLGGNFGQALLAAAAVRYFDKESPRFDSFRGVTVFTVGAALLAPVIVSTIAAYLYVLSGYEQDYWYVWRARVVSNALSALTIVPPLFLTARRIVQPANTTVYPWIEGGLIAIGLILTAVVALWTATPAAILLYAPFPLLLWAAVRLGMAGLCVSILVTAHLLFLDASSGQGPFVTKSAAENMLSLQLFLITISVPLMFLAALTSERQNREATLRDSEARYRALVMASAEMVWRADHTGEGFFVSSDWQQLTGQSEEETRSFGWLAAVHPHDRERSKRLWEAALQTRSAYENEMRIQTSAGGYRHFHVNAVPILTPDGIVHEWVGANTDITERKRAETRLRIQHEITHILSESGSMAAAGPSLMQTICTALDCEFGEIWQVDRERNVLACHSNWHLQSETGLEEFASASRLFTFAAGVGLPGRVWGSGVPAWISDLAADSNFPRARLAAKAGLRSAFCFPVLAEAEILGVMAFFSSEVRKPEADLLTMLASVGNQIGQFIERKSAEQELTDARTRLEATVAAGEVATWVWDIRNDRIFADKNLARLFSVSPDDAAGGPLANYLRAVHPADLPRVNANISEAITGGNSYEVEYRVMQRDGGTRWVCAKGRVERDAAANPIQFPGVIIDITDRKLAEEALRASEEHLRLALEAGQMGVSEWNLRSGIGKWSKENYTIMGLEPFSVEPTYEVWAERVHPDDRDNIQSRVEKAAEEKTAFQCEYRIIRPDGLVRWVESRARPVFDENEQCVRLVGVFADITERKEAEEALKTALEEVQRLKERTEAENVYLREEVSREHRFGEIIGRSQAMLSVLRQAEQVASTDTTVLILGETGTGKELLARAIHARSKRSHRPLLKVDCAALPASLIESELFGHEKGAFTGAAAKRVGRFELADGATIFLDEIGELPLDLQAKLLRVLQEGEFERLGSSKTMRTNVRVIAATNRDLRRAIEERKFRQDLYYRLNVYPINIPPLRERKADIASLALDFLTESSRRLGKSFSGLPQRLLDALNRYDWPGNVRELQNVIERAALVSTGSRLRLPEGWASAWFQESSDDEAASSSQNGTKRQPLTIEEVEREHVVRVLWQTHWRIEGPAGAAAILGIHPSTLRSRMNKLGIRR
jgi:PAS domain S-box-containing protein